MPTTPRSTPRGVLRWAAAVTLLVGLVAMHGLPMDRPGRMTGHAMASAPASPTAGSAAAPDLRPTAGGCTATDHCTATLRSADPLAVPAAVGGPDTPLDPGSAGSTLRPGDRPARAPPDLVALGISRT